MWKSTPHDLALRIRHTYLQRRENSVPIISVDNNLRGSLCGHFMWYASTVFLSLVPVYPVLCSFIYHHRRLNRYILLGLPSMAYEIFKHHPGFFHRPNCKERFTNTKPFTQCSNAAAPFGSVYLTNYVVEVHFLSYDVCPHFDLTA